MTILSYLLLGLVAGIFSGTLGVGGGAILVPALVMIYGLSQHQAQGTTLAIMLPPVFLLAVLRYYQEGHVRVSMAVWAAIGLTVGGLIGAHMVQGVGDAMLKKIFGIVLIIVGVKMALLR